MSNVQGAMSNELKTEEHVVAFIDVLGATELINQDQDSSLKIIRDTYERAIRIDDTVSKILMVNRSVSVFSDNIVISLKIDEQTSKLLALQLVTLSTITFQHNMLQRGLLTRGGITIGGFYKDNTMVWGKALVRAHELENKLAVYPRVVLDPQLVDLLRETNPKGFSLASYFLLDQDGLYYVDCYKIQDDLRTGYAPHILKNLMAKRDEYAGKDRIVQKYDWLISFVKRKIEAYERQ